jgi:hypothetical protein
MNIDTNKDYKHYIYSYYTVKNGNHFLTFYIRECITDPKVYQVGNEYKFNREYLGVTVS